MRPTRCLACRQRLEPSSTRPRRYCDDACRQAAARARRKRSVHFSSATDEWATPQSRFDELNTEFAPGFDLDVCATADNAKCARYFTRGDDGLVQTWTGVCWMNPPYGRAIGAWVQKAYESVMVDRTATLVVCLLPARTDTAWWHDYVLSHAAEVRHLRGRLRFGNAKAGAPFPSAVVVFRSGLADAPQVTEHATNEGAAADAEAA